MTDYKNGYLSFSLEEITGDKCINSMVNMVHTYQHASPKEQSNIEQRLQKHCPQLADHLIALCKAGVRKDLPNIRAALAKDIDQSEQNVRGYLTQLQCIADGTIE